MLFLTTRLQMQLSFSFLFSFSFSLSLFLAFSFFSPFSPYIVVGLAVCRAAVEWHAQRCLAVVLVHRLPARGIGRTQHGWAHCRMADPNLQEEEEEGKDDGAASHDHTKAED
jgi:hypothetical protein